MKKIVFPLIFLFNFYSSTAQSTDSIIDIRDEQVYKIVKIGEQLWMQKNLNIGTRLDKNYNSADNKVIEKYCYNDDPDICKIFGGLYQWNEMMDYMPSDNKNPGTTQGICPIGWHLPSWIEWTELSDFLGGEYVAGGKLKETGTGHWADPNTGATNESGFTALPGGLNYWPSNYEGIGNLAYFWSSWESSIDAAWNMSAKYDSINVAYSYLDKRSLFSVRCLRDSSHFSYLDISDMNLNEISRLDFTEDLTSNSIILINSSAWKTLHVTSIYTSIPEFNIDQNSSSLSPGDSVQLYISFNAPTDGIHYHDTLYIESDDPFNPLIGVPLSGCMKIDSIIDDRDGQIYKVVKIGNQRWFAENLRAIQYNDSTPIPIITDNNTWNTLITPAYSWYDNDDTVYKTIYGALYNWFTIETGNLCPSGWHVPADLEWAALENYLGGSNVAGGKLKEYGTDHWQSPNTGATNETGFTAVPGGCRGDYGTFYYLGTHGTWWSSTRYDSVNSGTFNLFYDSTSSSLIHHQNQIGFSVRCVQNIEQLQTDLVGNNTSAIYGSDGSIDLTVTGGIPPYKILWSNGLDDEDLTNISAGVYSVTVIDAIEGSITDSIRIYDTFIDERDGKRYKITMIGEQIWFAENINTGQRITNTQSQSNNQIIEKYCYNNDEGNCNGYGGLYQWDEMMQYTLNESTQGICPSSWHIPGDEEWKKLEIALGMSIEEADKWGQWRGTDQGTQIKSGGTSGFEALIAGCRSWSGYNFVNQGISGYFWSSTKGIDYTTNSIGRAVEPGRPGIWRKEGNKGNGYSVRCVANACDFNNITLKDSIININCPEQSSGEIYITVVGGIAPYSFLWSNGDTVGYRKNLPAGSYSIKVNDLRGCEKNAYLNVSQPDTFIISFEKTEFICNGDSNGTINTNVTGGTEPYVYLWNNGKTTPNLTDLPAGTYLLTLRDNNNCLEIASDTIHELPKVITSQITGHSTVEAAEVYQYSVSQKIGSEFNWIVEGGNLVSGQGTNTINIQWANPGNGKISVIETDENLCQGDTIRFEVTISTGYFSPENRQIKIFPNPLSDKAIIKLPNPLNYNYDLVIIDLTGKVIRRIDKISDNSYIFKRDDLQSGIYIIELRGPVIYRGKIIIE